MPRVVSPTSGIGHMILELAALRRWILWLELDHLPITRTPATCLRWQLTRPARSQSSCTARGQVKSLGGLKKELSRRTSMLSSETSGRSRLKAEKRTTTLGGLD